MRCVFIKQGPGILRLCLQRALSLRMGNICLGICSQETPLFSVLQTLYHVCHWWRLFVPNNHFLRGLFFFSLPPTLTFGMVFLSVMLSDTVVLLLVQKVYFVGIKTNSSTSCCMRTTLNNSECYQLFFFINCLAKTIYISISPN